VSQRADNDSEHSLHNGMGQISILTLTPDVTHPEPPPDRLADLADHSPIEASRLRPHVDGDGAEDGEPGGEEDGPQL
jgi:hypothetical protein